MASNKEVAVIKGDGVVRNYLARMKGRGRSS